MGLQCYTLVMKNAHRIDLVADLERNRCNIYLFQHVIHATYSRFIFSNVLCHTSSWQCGHDGKIGDRTGRDGTVFPLVDLLTFPCRRQLYISVSFMSRLAAVFSFPSRLLHVASFWFFCLPSTRSAPYHQVVW